MIPHPRFIELPSRDIDAARSFYAASFGWELVGYGPSYACTLGSGVDVGLQADPEEVTQAPLPMIAVGDLEATQARVEEAGGRIVRAIFAFPGGRRFHFLDPNNNEVAAMQADAQADS